MSHRDILRAISVEIGKRKAEREEARARYESRPSVETLRAHDEATERLIESLTGFVRLAETELGFDKEKVGSGIKGGNAA